MNENNSSPNGGLDIKEMLTGGIHRMSHVYRYSSLPTLRKENVAEHTFYVVLYSYLIGKDLDARFLEDLARIHPSIDFGDLLARALLHDIDESHTGDFLRTVKYGHPDLKTALDQISESMVHKMSTELGVDFYDPWKGAKNRDMNGWILEIADLARVVSYVMEEIKSGNRHIVNVLAEVRDYYKKVVDDPRFIQQLNGYVMDILDVVEENLHELGYECYGLKGE